MKKYYVIFKVKNGIQEPAYIINNVDNDLSHHLECQGDCYVSYIEYNSYEIALQGVNIFNNLLIKE